MLLADYPVLTPDSVLHLPQDLSKGGRRWWLLWTESTREKRLSGELAANGALPLTVTNIVVIKRYNGAGRLFKERKEVNLFPNYVLANGTDAEIWKAKERSWAQVVPIIDQARTIQQVARVMEFSASHNNLKVEKLKAGMKVQVIRGPFLGREAIVVSTNEEKGRVCLEVSLFGLMVPTDIAVEDVEAL